MAKLINSIKAVLQMSTWHCLQFSLTIPTFCQKFAMFMNTCHSSYAWCNPPVWHEICTHSVVCWLVFRHSSSWAFETARGSGYILKSFTSLSRLKFVLYSFPLMVCHVACRPFIRSQELQHPCVEQRPGCGGRVLSLCNTKATVARAGSFWFCRKKLLLCSMKSCPVGWMHASPH